MIITSHARDLAYAGHTSPIEYLVDRFVHPLDEWSVIRIVSCEDGLKFVGSFQLVSGTAYCGGLPGKRYSEVAGPQMLVLSRKENPI